MSGDERAYFFYLLLLLLLVMSGFVYGRREKLSTTLQQAAIWVLIFAGVLIAYGFKDTLQQQFTPTQAKLTGSGYEIPRARDGHFYLTLGVNGQDVLFVVDTGATSIVLTQEAAADVGIDLGALAYIGRANTANGVVRTAPVVLEEVRLDDLVDRDVRASVNGGEMTTSLLGMTYLSRFSEISMRQDRMILRP